MITFGGLASGLDTGSLIDQLVSAERSVTTKLNARKFDLTTHTTIVGNLTTAMAALGTAARGLDLDSELRPRAGAVTDNRISVAVSASAEPRVHDLRVKQLATSQITQSNTYGTDAAGVAGTGTLKIKVGTAEKTVSYGPTDTLSNIAKKINESDAGVSANVLFDGTNYRLIVAAKNMGTAAAPTFEDAGSGLGLSNGANVNVAATNSIVNIDGVDVTRPTNVVSDALAGITLTLNSAHLAADASPKLTVSLDQKSLTDKLKTLVSAYNTVNTQLQTQLNFTGTTKGTNTLFGDATLRQLQSSLNQTMTSAYGSANLGQLGITRDKTGVMTLDETKFVAAIAADPDAASKLFVAGGFATGVGKLADAYTKTGDGIFSSKSTSITQRSKVLQDQIERVDRNADSLRTRLEAQFGALEKAISSLQSQSSYLLSALRY